MLPVLFRFPSKILFAVAVFAGLGLVLAWRQGWMASRWKRSPLYVWAGAWYLLWVCGHSVVPSPGALGAPWDPLTVYSYPSMLGLALLAGWLLVARLAPPAGIPVELAAKIYLWTAGFSFLGARLLFLITEYRHFESVFDPALLTRGGLVAYGGMLGGFLASWYLCRRRKISLLRWADAAVPSVALGTAITRMGCYLFGCDFGRRTDVPWAIRFPAQSPAWVDHVASGQLSDSAPWSLAVHPTQLYESLAGLALLALVLFLRRKRPFPGLIFLSWVAGYGLLRSLIEVYRGDADRGGIGPFSTSQIIGLLSFLLACVALLRLFARRLRSKGCPANE